MEVHTDCAICGADVPSTVVYPEHLDLETFTPEVFSARRIPDRRYYQWVRCDKCSLFRSDPVRDVDLSALYSGSTFEYVGELKGLTETYRRILLEGLNGAPYQGTILEIGGGNGFFLDAALDDGFSYAIEVEPSVHAISQASERIRSQAIVDVMRDGLVPNASVDVVAIFHALDHLPDPMGVLKSCHRALKPGGVIVIGVHNVESWSARLLKTRSPIFDVEHTYLYSEKTGPLLLERAGFTQVRCAAYSNKYSLNYLTRLLPLSRPLKAFIARERIAPALKRCHYEFLSETFGFPESAT